MHQRSLNLIRGLAMSVALTIGIATVAPALAAQSDAVLPPGTVDGAARILNNDDDPSAPVYSFTVLTFADEAAAQAAVEMVIAEDTAQIEAGDGDGGATPTPLDISRVDVSDELTALVDSADLLTVSVSDSGLDLETANLIIRQDTTIFSWSTIQTLSEATPDDGSAPDLDALAVSWFAEDRTGGALIDSLPGVDALPNGYSEVFTANDLDELQSITGDATPAS